MTEPADTVIDVPPAPTPKTPSTPPAAPRRSLFRRTLLGLPIFIWLSLLALIALALLIYLIVALTTRTSFTPPSEPSEPSEPPRLFPPCNPSVDRFPTKITLQRALTSTICEFSYSNTHVDFTICPSSALQEQFPYRLAPPDCDPPAPPAPRTLIRSQPSVLYVAESPTLAYLATLDPSLSSVAFVPQAFTFFNPTLRNRVADNLTLEIATDFIPDFSLLTNAPTPPQLSLIGEFGVDSFRNASLNLTWLPVADPSARTPLERAEWIKLMGLIMGREEVANRRFEDVESRYLQIRDSAAGAVERPSVFFNSPFDNSWSQPGGEQYIAMLAADAGADYRFADDGERATLTLTLEQVEADFGNAEFLVNTGGFPGRNDSTLETFFQSASEEEREVYRELRAVRCGRVFSRARRITEDGMANDFFETGAVRPDLMLADFVEVFQRQRTEGMHYQYWLGRATPDVVGDGACVEETRRGVVWDASVDHHFAVKGRGRWEMERVVGRARVMLRGMRELQGRQWRLYFTNGGRKGEVGVALSVEVRGAERGNGEWRGRMGRVRAAVRSALGTGVYGVSRREFARRLSVRAAAVRAGRGEVH